MPGRGRADPCGDRRPGKDSPLRRAPLACLAVALAATAAPAAASGAVETWPATPGDKVFPASTRPAGAAAGPVIGAARDEYEGAQIAIRSDVALEITPLVSDLTGPGTIPASAVELLRVGYVGLKRVSTGVDALEGDGRYPDPLFPITGTLAVPAGETTSVYALVHVPADATAGRYTGTLELDAAGVVPLVVEVAPVTAGRDGYTIVARLNQIQLAKASGVSEDDARFVRGVYDRLLPMLRAHGVNPGKPPHTAPKVDPATWALDYADSPFGTARRTNLNAFFGMGFPAVEVPFLPNFPQAGGEDRAYTQEGKRRTAARDFASTLRADLRAHLRAAGGRAQRRSTYAQLNRAAAQLASATPRIPVLATEAPHPEALKAIGRSVNIWAPPIWDLFKVPKGVASVRAKGKRVWWYTYGSDTQRYTPNVLIDKPTTEPRVMGWLAAKEGVDGFFYWGLNNWGGENYHSPFDDPWYLSHTKAADTCGRRRRGGRQRRGEPDLPDRRTRRTPRSAACAWRPCATVPRITACCAPCRRSTRPTTRRSWRASAPPTPGARRAGAAPAATTTDAPRTCLWWRPTRRPWTGRAGPCSPACRPPRYRPCRAPWSTGPP